MSARRLVPLVIAMCARVALADPNVSTAPDPDLWAAPPVIDPAEPAGFAPLIPQHVVARAAVVGGGVKTPLAAAVDAWIDLDQRFRLGITGSDSARHLIGTGRGLCVARCPVRFSGAAIEGQAVVRPWLVARGAFDSVQFAPEVAALEAGADLRVRRGDWAGALSPVLRFGVVRRDLSNHDTAAVLGEARGRVWDGGGVLAFARWGMAFDDPRGAPAIAAAIGAWWELDRVSLAVRAGSGELSREPVHETWFAELSATVDISPRK